MLQVSRADNKGIFISQQRFLIHTTANDKLEPGLWYVPIWFITKSNSVVDMDNFPPSQWMEPDTLTLYLNANKTEEEWIILNPEARGGKLKLIICIIIICIVNEGAY